MGRRAGHKGFNLLELVLASLLFSIISISMIGVWMAYAQMTGKARSTLVATHLAEKVMEDQLALGWSAESIPRDPANVFLMTQIVDGNNVDIEYGYYVDVNDLSVLPYVGLKQIVVHVYWNGKGGEKEVSCESMVYWGG